MMAFGIQINNDLGTPFSWFSFEDAVKRASSGYLQLSDAGCLLDDDPIALLRNCSAACLYNDRDIRNPVWGNKWSPYTLQNCLVYPYVAWLLAMDSVTTTSSSLAIHEYGIRPDRTIDNGSWPVVNDCISAFCALQGLGEAGCKTTWADQWTYTGAGLAWNQSINNITMQLFPNASYIGSSDSAWNKFSGNESVNLPWVRRVIRSSSVHTNVCA